MDDKIVEKAIAEIEARAANYEELGPQYAVGLREAIRILQSTRDQFHTVKGKTSETGWPYGTTHDMDCPACVASGSSFTASPRSETYWSS